MATKRSRTNRTKKLWDDDVRKNIRTGILIVLGLICSYLVKMLQVDSFNPIDAYLNAQAGIDSVYINTLVLIATSYSKTTKDFHMNGFVYLFNIFGIILIIHIFAQAIFMVYPEVNVFAEFMRSRWCAIGLNIVFFIVLILISCLSGEVEYIKDKPK